MKFFAQSLLALGLASTAIAAPVEERTALAPLAALPAGANATGGHIVVLKDNVLSVQSLIATLGLPLRSALGGHGVSQYFDTVLKGWSGKFDDATLDKIRRNPLVAYVEPDTRVKASYTQTGSTYGLAISSQKSKLSSAQMGTYYWKDPAGKGVTVYVLDTGIYTEHSDFGGRAKMVANFVPNAPANTDDHGHGTHCAGTIGGKTFGVAKAATLAGIKVLDYSGYGDNSNVITGINYAVRHCGAGKCVISMSLGGDVSQALNQAVDNAFRRGIPVIVAAGNSNLDACTGSPSSAPNAITVGAIDSGYRRADFSNWGKCVDLSAPGVEVESTWLGAKDMTHFLSGTSMATPHVAGIAATWLSSGKATGANLTQVLINSSQKNLITDLKGGTPNLLANNGYWLP